MAKNNLQFKGFEELGQVFDALPGRLGPKVVQGILRKAAKPIVAEAKRLSSNADVSGDTTESIGIIANRSANGLTIGPRRTGKYNGWYAHILEYGSAAHVIRPKKGKALSFLGGTFKSANHPGTVAQPFMRPAFDLLYPVAVRIIKEECKIIIDSGFKTIKF